jgi:beta-phosphoglucomutase
MALRAIFFDFDGVLVDSEPLHWETWAEVLKPEGIALGREEYWRRFIGVSSREMMRLLWQDGGRPFDQDLFQTWYARKRALYAARELRVPDDVAEFIRSQLGDYRLGVVSSSRRSEVEPYLEGSGIRKRIEVLVCAEDVTELKPSPAPYRRAADLAGLPPEDCLAVEDSEAGVASATGAGMHAVRVEGPVNVVSVVSDKIYYVQF